VKDLFETAGIRTTAGALGYSGYIPRYRRRIVSRLEAAGAIVMGKTNTKMLAVLGTSADGATLLAARIASELPMEIAEKQRLLETLDPVQGLEEILARLSS
jgi:Amidase